MSETETGTALHLVCQPLKSGNLLAFPYSLENRGPREVYAMQALPSASPSNGKAYPDHAAAIVIAGEDQTAILGKFAAPAPIDRYIAVPIVPLARRLPAGAILEGQIEIPLPLAEASPYFPDLLLRQYAVVEIRAIIFTIGYWLADAHGLRTVPAAYAPDLFEVETQDTQRSARRVTRWIPTQGLHLFKRTDAFPCVLV